MREVPAQDLHNIWKGDAHEFLARGLGVRAGARSAYYPSREGPGVLWAFVFTCGTQRLRDCFMLQVATPSFSHSQSGGFLSANASLQSYLTLRLAGRHVQLFSSS